MLIYPLFCAVGRESVGKSRSRYVILKDSRKFATTYIILKSRREGTDGYIVSKRCGEGCAKC